MDTFLTPFWPFSWKSWKSDNFPFFEWCRKWSINGSKTGPFLGPNQPKNTVKHGLREARTRTTGRHHWSTDPATTHTPGTHHPCHHCGRCDVMHCGWCHRAGTGSPGFFWIQPGTINTNLVKTATFLMSKTDLSKTPFSSKSPTLRKNFFRKCHFWHFFRKKTLFCTFLDTSGFECFSLFYRSQVSHGI